MLLPDQTYEGAAPLCAELACAHVSPARATRAVRAMSPTRTGSPLRATSPLRSASVTRAPPERRRAEPQLVAVLRAHRARPDFFCANRHRAREERTRRWWSEQGSRPDSRRARRDSRPPSVVRAAAAAAKDASSSNEAVHLQRRLLSLSSELVSLRNHLHAPDAPRPAVPPRADHPPPPPPPPEPKWRSNAVNNKQTIPQTNTPAAVVQEKCAKLEGLQINSDFQNNLDSYQNNADNCQGKQEKRHVKDVEICDVQETPQIVQEGSQSNQALTLDDLIHLRGPHTEDSVVKVLQTRFYHNKFYTWVGPVVVAVNPFTDGGNALTPGAARGPRPELARLVHDAVRHHADTGYPQAIILSGVSGSGKTYASMVLLRRLFEVAGGGAETDAFKHLAAAFTVLRALGTAHTPHNHHSSRIGHFIEVQVTDGALYRTKIHCYFLDQTRVVRPLPGERNYHIFYQMLAGLTADERARLHLEGMGPGELRYLSGRGLAAATAVDGEEGARFAAWRTCLGVLGIPFLDVVRVLAAVLLLGNVTFTEGAEGEAEPQHDRDLAAAAALLGVGAGALLRGLGARQPPRCRSVRAAATPAAAAAARDALAKALYCRTVATIVRRANSLKRLGSTLGTLSSDSNESVHNQDAASRRSAGGRGPGGSMAALNDAVRHVTDGFVGILDMFGFEDAAPSRLEHLCANLCAETMQHFYNTHVFKSSAESCREEGVSCVTVQYADNVPCIDLVSSLRGGLLAALDAECAARGTPERYASRVLAAHRTHPRLADARPPHARRFIVRHYAGDVTYDATEFLEANRDSVPDELVAAFDRRTCEFGFATHLFGAELKALAAGGGARGAQFRASPTAHAAPAHADRPASTLTQDFHTRLDNLLRTLVHARPHFVRCVRANGSEAPMIFEKHVVAKQVRALQVLETATLMSTGYPHRMRFRAFLSRYRAVSGVPPSVQPDDGADLSTAVLRAMESAAPPPASPAHVRWAIGKRHVFLSEGMRQVLEVCRRGRRAAAAGRIQRAWRRRRAPPARARPAPLAGTPPPDAPHALLRHTCTLFGLDLERPPPLPPSRAYTVSGGVKVGYPQTRDVTAPWADGNARLAPGESVTVLGAARPGHLNVQINGRLVAVPHGVLGPPRAAPRPPPPPPLHQPSAAAAPAVA